MDEIRQFRESTLPLEETISGDSPSAKKSGFCAYHRTGQRFISNEVEVVEATEGDFEDCYSSLLPGSGTAIWTPIRVLSSTSFCIPVDLLYLDDTFTVLATVESFPVARLSSPMERAASILTLPARTITTMEIEVGDQLLMCSPEELLLHLLNERPLSPDEVRQLLGVEQEAEELDGPTEAPAAAPQPPEPARVEEWRPAAVPVPLSDSATVSSAVSTPKPAAAPAPVAAPAPIAAPEVVTFTAPAPVAVPVTAPAPVPAPPAVEEKVSWWRKLLLGPDDQRWGERKPVPGLVAYFFTGGAPKPHLVRDISTSGIYVLTSERWYQGTYVRLTLTDERDPSAEKSLTLYAKVVRSADDGVGLEFLLHENTTRIRDFSSTFDQMPPWGMKEIREFVAQFKPGVKP